jgi:aromatic ring-opening dioxygenase catalytic subunit (LigB family)
MIGKVQREVDPLTGIDLISHLVKAGALVLSMEQRYSTNRGLNLENWVPLRLIFPDLVVLFTVIVAVRTNPLES